MAAMAAMEEKNIACLAVIAATRGMPFSPDGALRGREPLF